MSFGLRERWLGESLLSFRLWGVRVSGMGLPEKRLPCAEF